MDPPMHADKRSLPKASTSIINRKSSIINRDACHFLLASPRPEFRLQTSNLTLAAPAPAFL
jgi:hypothetical protein